MPEWWSDFPVQFYEWEWFVLDPEWEFRFLNTTPPAGPGPLIPPNTRPQVHYPARLFRRPATSSGQPPTPIPPPLGPGALVVPNVRARTKVLPRLVRSNTSGQVPAPILAGTGPFVPPNVRARVRPTIMARHPITDQTPPLPAIPPPPNIRVRTVRLPRIVRPNTSGTELFPILPTAGPLIPPNTRPRVKWLPYLRRPNDTDMPPIPTLAGLGALVPPNVRKRIVIAFRVTPRQSQPPVPPPVVPGSGPLVVPNTRPRLKQLPIVRRPDSGLVPESILAGPGPLIPPNVRARVRAFIMARRPITDQTPGPAQIPPAPNVRPRLARVWRAVPRQAQPPLPILAGQGPLIPPNVRRRVVTALRLTPRQAQPPVPLPVITTATIPPPNTRPLVHWLRSIRRPNTSGQVPAPVLAGTGPLVAPNIRVRTRQLPRIVRSNTGQAEFIPSMVQQLLAMPAGSFPASVYPAGATIVNPVANTPVITPVGALQSTTGTGKTTMAALGVNIGDLLVCLPSCNNTTAGPVVNSIATSGTLTTSTWQKGIAYFGTGRPNDLELWYATVTGVGSGTLTFSWSSSVAAHRPEYDLQEFSMLGANTWTLDKTAHLDTGSGTALDFPTLTPQVVGELYIAIVNVANFPISGFTTAYGYPATADTNLLAICTDCNGAAQAPTATQNASATGATSIGALFRASNAVPPAGSPVITDVSPKTGPIAGGTLVSIYGKGFTGTSGVAGVKFGATNATSYTVVSDTLITATSPAGIALVPAIDIFVNNGIGTSLPTTGDYFTYTQANGIIYPVGTLQGYTDQVGGLTQTVSGQNVGDLLVMCMHLARPGAGTAILSSITTSGTLRTTAWQKAIQNIETGGNNGDNEIWWAKVLVAGSGTLTFAFSSSISGGSYQPDYSLLEFGATGGWQTWAQDGAGAGQTNGASTTIAYPSLTPAAAHELYVGLANPIGDFPTNGATSGYQYPMTMASLLVAFNPNCGAGAQAPTGLQDSSNTSSSAAALFKVSP